jgi:hypothetical protein
MFVFAILLIFLLLAAIVVFRALIPIAVGAILMVIAIIAVCTFFKDIPGTDSSPTISRAAQRAIGIGSVFLIPGLIICIQSRRSYRALLSGALVIGGPHPIGILLVIIGIGILIFGIVSLIKRRKSE